MFQSTSAGVGQVEHRGVIGPIGNTEQGVMFLCNAFHVVNEGLEAGAVGLVPTAVPPFQVMETSGNVVRDGGVRVDFNDAVQHQVSALGGEVPLLAGIVQVFV